MRAVHLHHAVAYLAIHSETRPYKTGRDTQLATYSHMSLLLMLFCGLLVKVNQPYREAQNTVVSWFILIAHAGVMSFGVFTFVRDVGVLPPTC